MLLFTCHLQRVTSLVDLIAVAIADFAEVLDSGRQKGSKLESVDILPMLVTSCCSVRFRFPASVTGCRRSPSRRAGSPKAISAPRRRHSSRTAPDSLAIRKQSLTCPSTSRPNASGVNSRKRCMSIWQQRRTEGTGKGTGCLGVPQPSLVGVSCGVKSALPLRRTLGAVAASADAREQLVLDAVHEHPSHAGGASRVD